MSLRRILATIVLILAGAFGSANAQSCVSSASLPVSYGANNGNITINYQVCYTSNFSSIYWSGTMLYNNVSFDGTYRINGSVTLTVNFSGSSVGSIVFSGGPLTYTFGSTPYTVSFNNMAFNFSSALQPTTASGSLTINGQAYPASGEYWAYLFR